MCHRVLLKKLHVKNLGPIKDDVVQLDPFTYFVGRNNSGKSHYIRAIELLLATKNPTGDEVFKLQNDKTQDILIEGEFEGVDHFAALLAKSKHKEVIEKSIQKGVLRVARILTSSAESESAFGVYDVKGELENPSGFAGNLLKVLPDPISIVATADTADELISKGNTAIMKLKKEVLSGFLEELKTKTKDAFAAVNDFLHSQEGGKRSADLIAFENSLKEELTGEFSDIVPSVEFDLPDEDVVAQKMKLFLDDGHRSEVEQKGHGLQRATLLALLRLLARQGERYRERPAPMFLVGELETFLHPYAQRQLAYALNLLADRYQIITTTHSPFIITPENVEGYRRVKKSEKGTVNLMPDWADLEVEPVKRHLEWRGNLEGLFADRVVLIEGTHDENFYERVRSVFGIPFPTKQFTLFVKTSGKKQLRIVRNFYLRMGFDDVAVVTDLDYLFCSDAKQLLKEIGVDPAKIDAFRKHIGWSGAKDPSLKDVLAGVAQNGLIKDFDATLQTLEKHRVFVLKHGAPEHYCKDGQGRKNAWTDVAAESDLLEVAYLKALITEVLK